MRFLPISILMLFTFGSCSEHLYGFDISIGLKKIADSASQEISSLELYLSPITPGGQWGFTANVKNFYLAAVGKLECKWTECKITISKPLIDRYVEEILLPTDDELAEYNNDPTPDRDYEANLQRLKDARRTLLRLETMQKYHVIPKE